MFPIRWRRGCCLAVAATSVLCLLSACGPARPAYFQPQSRPYLPAVGVNTAPQPDAPPIPTNLSTPDPAATLARTSLPTSASSPVETAIRIRASKRGVLSHSNPDSYPVQRLNRTAKLSATGHAAPRSHLIDRHSPARKTHPLALLALGIAVLSYGSLLFTGGSTLLWVLSITLPLGATMLGTASLMTINRHKDRYRGKGWAMAAIVIGSGALGLALMAVAALSVSKMVWEK